MSTTIPRDDAPAAYRVPFDPVIPVVFLLASAWLLTDALVRNTGPTLFGFGIIASGIPVYYLWKGRG